MNLIKLLSNPVRMQIMQYLQIYGEATTKQISEALTEVAAPTLYRHINILLEEGALSIKEERKVRGSLERLLTINRGKIAEAENGNVADAAYQFLMELFARFQEYSLLPDADPKRDRLSMRSRILSLTDEEMDSLFQEMAALINRYDEKGGNAGGKKRSISIISAPFREEAE